MTKELDIPMVRGNTLAFGMNFYDLNQDLGYAYFTVRKGEEGDLLFQKSIGNGITKVSDGIYRVRVAPSDTENLELGRYFYDLEIGLNGDVFTLIRGYLELKADGTRED